MALYSSANGRRLVKLSLTMAAFGSWVADVTLAEAEQLQPSVQLVASNLELRGTVIRQDAFAGQREARVVGGAGGWRKQVSSRSYRQPGGLPLSTVLRDAAIEVGETVHIGTDRTIGTDYVRERAPASRVLRHLVGRAWWIDAAGVTQLGARPSTQVKTEFAVVRYSADVGLLVIATEDLASWLPGATFSNALVTTAKTVASSSIRMEGPTLRVEVMVA